MRGLFLRGKFTDANGRRGGDAFGLCDWVDAICADPQHGGHFSSRGDTWTPVKALLFAVAANVVLKVLLYEQYAQVGLAFATSIGAWVNVALLWWFAAKAKLVTFDEGLRRSAMRLGGRGPGARAGALYWRARSAILSAGGRRIAMS